MRLFIPLLECLTEKNTKISSMPLASIWNSWKNFRVVEHVKWGHVCAAGGSLDHPVCKWRREARKSLDTMSSLAYQICLCGTEKNVTYPLGTCKAYADLKYEFIAMYYLTIYSISETSKMWNYTEQHWTVKEMCWILSNHSEKSSINLMKWMKRCLLSSI